MFRWFQYAVLIFWGQVVHAQVPAPEVLTVFDREVHLKADGSRGPYRLSGQIVAAAEVQVWVAGVLQVAEQDYRVDAQRAHVTFFKQLNRGDDIVIRFRQVPQGVSGVYRRRVLQDDEALDGPKPQRSVSVAVQQEEAPRLEIGGRKSIQVTFGSAQNHRVNQALQMHIAGDVADGVSVLAVLSDQNLPISEQGSTLGLRELDRILFQVRGPQVAASLGDLDVHFNRTHLGRYRRQLQGAQVLVDRDEGQFSAVGAVSRGQWRTERVVGVEGYQGPYRLPGTQGFSAAVVLESERVFLNGLLLRRGEQLDYVLDYERGLLTFAPEQPIVASSRILVEYQILDAHHNSRLIGVDGQVLLGQSGWAVGSTLIRESDQSVLAGVETLGSGGTHRQVLGLDATYAPRDGVHLRSEVAWSDDEAGKGHAVDVDGLWTVGTHAHNALHLTGRFRQVSVGFEGFERLDVGMQEGRWGWQPRERLQDVREGEVGAKYTWHNYAVNGAWGRRTGDGQAERRALGVTAPFARYAYEQIKRQQGGLTRHTGEITGAHGIFQSGIRGDFERATGDGVASTSLFYGAGSRGVGLQGVRLDDVVWHVGAGQKAWHWRSELGGRRIRQLQTAWQDSLRAWSHKHDAQIDWQGWSVLGSYGQTVSHLGAVKTTRRVTHLGRSRLHYSRSGFSQQIFYRVSSAGVQTNQPIYVDVGRGMGAYVWEDVDGDGEQDPEEFVPDVDGNFEVVYNFGHSFLPAREGILGVRGEMDLGRLLGRSKGFVSGLSLDASLQADRKVTSNAVSPWQVLGVNDTASVQFAQRDGRVRLHMFRYHKRGSFTVSGRIRDRLDRLFYGGGKESTRQLRLGGRVRFGRLGEWEGDVETEGRHRTGTEAFAYAIRSYAGQSRGLWRPTNRWDIRLGVTGARDYDAQRDLLVHAVSVQPEVIRRLRGRGRMRARVDWTRVFATGDVPLFLGMAQGNRVGQNWVWRLGMDYRFGRYVTALVSYDGRKRPTLPVLHVGRMEMRAVF